MINHLWNAKFRRNATPGRIARVLGWLLTFLCVVVAWIVFRADGMNTAMSIYKGMLGMHGAPASAFSEFGKVPFRKPEFFQLMLVAIVICLTLPPTITLERWIPHPKSMAGRPVMARLSTVVLAIGTFALFAWCVSKLGGYSPFLYFQF